MFNNITKKLIIFVILFSSSAFAKELVVDGQKLKLIGATKLTVFFFDVYYINYYKNDTASAVKLKYLRDVSADQSKKGWIKGLEKFESDVGKKFLLSNVDSVVEGDEIILLKASKTTSKYFLNGQLKWATNEPLIYKYLHYPWIGDEPIDTDLKQELLGLD